MDKYLSFQVTGDLKKDIKAYFMLHNMSDIYEHTMDVVRELHNMGQQFGFLEQGSEIACYCHDLGRVVEKDEVIKFCMENNINITDEEKQAPSILHQKISKFIAENLFEIKDNDVLNAIRYHTTSRKQPSKTEIEVFLADKLSWKDEECKEIVNKINDAIKHSKEKAMLCYLTDLELRKEELKLYHKDSKEAYEYFNQLIR
ncbi:HD domain-containing protein [Tissierella sp. MSJ-40]|uniref:HD domain-containing protein n=1 Tax=Tissierella simiarum TaxID=2841534 RepID=A0ABS6E9L8_9FIRM|nr:HD domain-containing protein [Tissierella simiarum]MBU5439625.1 HD domain-containing protein [Tissierella simiarum]